MQFEQENFLVNGDINDYYRSFISKSRYSRWLPDEGRRETWTEAVDRYIDFVKPTSPEVDDSTWAEIRSAILYHEIMPSMRGLMTAGEALERENLAIYNCSFVAVDDIRVFDESLYILMCGTGLGFSVEHEHVDKLPAVPANIVNAPRIITVEDSKLGWAEAYQELISCLYAGKIPAIDITKVRSAGERLKVFGGRASGPQPLIDLFNFTIEKFKTAAGRKLLPIEVHDIMCKIGEVVVVGGVRRSALISLSDLDSFDMAKAKSGSWWLTEPQRALANNSAVYNKKPSVGEFMREWGSLYDSKSGERGIFNKQQAFKNNSGGRRDVSKIVGTNPCGEILLRNCGLCNLTEVVVKPTDTVDTLVRKVELATILGTVQSTFTDFNHLRPVWRENAEDERLLGVSLTGQFGNELLSGRLGKRELRKALVRMRESAIETNKILAGAMGINASAAITTVKPSGTVSQLTYSGAGMHPWHALWFLRTVRGDNKDSMTKFLKFVGIPWEVDVVRPNDTTVFMFPQKAPEGAVTRNDLTAIEHLDNWLDYKRFWTEHNPSVTISVKEDEWIEVANWVYTHWEDVGGLSFLPYSDHVYKQAPYQEIDEATYNQWMADMPDDIDWKALESFEFEDNTTGTQTLACTSNVCELVNI